jgi:uncharacterized protein (DUF433 family)
MSLAIEREPIPLIVTSDGVVMVAGTRVSLDLIVAAFLTGSTAEQIVQQYPSVALPDAYATITYYLRHRNEVEAYLAQRRDAREGVRVEAERRSDPSGIRARLLARSA